VAQENAPNKPVHLIFFFGGILLFYLLQWTTDWFWGYFTRFPSELYITIFASVTALAVTLYSYYSDKVYGLVYEVAAELSKVTWPTAKDVRGATIVVIIMTIISATILGFFDLIWANLTKLIYG
jgi:preprotein translocase subunit SecE